MMCRLFLRRLIPLCIQVQHGIPCMWAYVEPNEEAISHILRTVGTGHEIPFEVGDSEYLGTYQLHEGAFVGHVFVDL